MNLLLGVLIVIVFTLMIGFIMNKSYTAVLHTEKGDITVAMANAGPNTNSLL